jgi:AcrR family transcriptional regulator
VARKYELKRRAERQSETRRRIVEAAVELHGTKGPGRTSLSEIARLAGVQRNTLYRHFPDERALLLACSAHHGAQHPPPDPSAWRRIGDPGERLRRGLGELYAWYAEVEPMYTHVLRDAEYHETVREIVILRSGEAMAAIRAALADGLPASRHSAAVLELALDFRAWQRLSHAGLPPSEAAEAMSRAVVGQVTASASTANTLARTSHALRPRERKPLPAGRTRGAEIP